MSAMQAFRSTLSSASRFQDQYVETLASLTAIDFDQLKALASKLGWQEWSPQNPEAEAAS